MISDQMKIYWKSFKILIMKGVSAVIKFLLISFITNSMGASAYGAYSYALSFFLIANVVARLGEDINSQKISAQLIYRGKYKDAIFRIISVFYTVIFSNVLLSAIVLSILLFFMKDEVKLLHFKILFPFGMFYSFVWIFAYFFRGIGKAFFILLNLEIVFPLLNLLFIYIYINAEYSEEFILSGSFISSLLVIFGIYISFVLIYSRNKSIDFSKYRLSCTNPADSLPFMVVTVSTMLLVWIDTFILGFYVSNEDIGIYTLVTRLGALILFPASALTVFFANKVVERVEAGDKNILFNEFVESTKYLFCISLLLFAVINLFADQILGLFGKDFVGGKSVLFVFSIAQLIIGTSGIFEAVFLMTDNKKLFLRINALMIIINISLGFPLINSFGILGAAYSTLIAVTVNRLIQYYYLRFKYFND